MLLAKVSQFLRSCVACILKVKIDGDHNAQLL